MSGEGMTIRSRSADDGKASWQTEAAVAQAKRLKWSAAVFIFSFLMAEAPYVIAGLADGTGAQTEHNRITASASSHR